MGKHISVKDLFKDLYVQVYFRNMKKCRHFPAQATKMVDKEIKFTSWVKTEPTLFQVYGDFECALKEEDSEEHAGMSLSAG